MKSKLKWEDPADYEKCKWVFFVPLPNKDGDWGDCMTVIVFTKPHRMH